MGHELAEKTAGLASRINNLAVLHSGSESRELLDLQTKLTKLELIAIVQDLNEEQDDYKKAISALNIAIKSIGEADKKIEKISSVIKQTKQAIDLLEKVLKVVISVF